MTKEELEKIINETQIRAEEEVRLAIKKYCADNNTVKIGDIVTDRIGSIMVEEIRFYLSRQNPQCVYIGRELKKNKDAKKRNILRSVYQSNVVKEGA